MIEASIMLLWYVRTWQNNNDLMLKRRSEDMKDKERDKYKEIIGCQQMIIEHMNKMFGILTELLEEPCKKEE